MRDRSLVHSASAFVTASAVAFKRRARGMSATCFAANSLALRATRASLSFSSGWSFLISLTSRTGSCDIDDVDVGSSDGTRTNPGLDREDEVVDESSDPRCISGLDISETPRCKAGLGDDEAIDEDLSRDCSEKLAECARPSSVLPCFSFFFSNNCRRFNFRRYCSKMDTFPV